MQSQLTKIRYSKWFWTVWLVWFLVWFGCSGFSQPYSYLGWIYKLDITQKAEIRHACSTHKNRISQGLLNSLVALGKVSKTSKGGGCTNFAPFGRRMLTPPIFGRSHLDPPQNAGTWCTPPPNRLRGRNFLKKNFVSPPQKSKIIANIPYTQAIFDEICGHSPHFSYSFLKTADPPPTFECNSKRPPPQIG